MKLSSDKFHRTATENTFQNEFNLSKKKKKKERKKRKKEKKKTRSLWTRAHLAFGLRTHNLVLVAKGT